MLLLMKTSYFISIVDVLQYIYITFIYNIVLLLNILCSCNALFTYTSKKYSVKKWHYIYSVTWA
jgi:hypothetical protein